MSLQNKIQRSVLPIPDQAHVGFTIYDAKDPDTKNPPIRELRPPQGAPNVLVVLIDDVGKDDFDHLISPEERLNLARLRP